MIMVAATAAPMAHAGRGIPSFVNTVLWSGGSAAGADDSEEPSAVIGAGDFNGDGITDLVDATSPDGNDAGQHLLVVRLGRADGTFTSVASRNVIGSDPRALAVADFNGDGRLDVIVGDGDGALLEFLGDGKGNLVNAG